MNMTKDIRDMMTLEKLEGMLSSSLVQFTIDRTSEKDYKELYCSNSFDVIHGTLPEGVETLDRLVDFDNKSIWVHVIVERQVSELFGDTHDMIGEWRKIGIDDIELDSIKYTNIDVYMNMLQGEDRYMLLDINYGENERIKTCIDYIGSSNAISPLSSREANSILKNILIGKQTMDVRQYLGNKEAYCNYEEIVTSCKSMTGLSHEQLVNLASDAFYTLYEQQYNKNGEVPRLIADDRYRSHLYECFRHADGIYTILEEVYNRPLEEMKDVYLALK